ncbi:hypothetical protein JRO89_XS01G0016200 [Xanthoceras sorbifolium]|uniref:Uncharacterized protein n=1 Tax=Xanthoceras sorbifolium TaxID=99658 RepID=A0ABQ8IJ78_9ROSI|nr:hypothetical protein JRO89_XS01G0016200 [Xanthoceras sorbifolium]
MLKSKEEEEELTQPLLSNQKGKAPAQSLSSKISETPPPPLVKHGKVGGSQRSDGSSSSRGGNEVQAGAGTGDPEGGGVATGTGNQGRGGGASNSEIQPEKDASGSGNQGGGRGAYNSEIQPEEPDFGAGNQGGGRGTSNSEIQPEEPDFGAGNQGGGRGTSNSEIQPEEPDFGSGNQGGGMGASNSEIQPEEPDFGAGNQGGGRGASNSEIQPEEPDFGAGNQGRGRGASNSEIQPEEPDFGAGNQGGGRGASNSEIQPEEPDFGSGNQGGGRGASNSEIQPEDGASNSEIQLEVGASSSACIFTLENSLKDFHNVYTPHVISMGPIHYGESAVQKMELVKKLYALPFTTKYGDHIHDFRNFLGVHEARIRESYDWNSSHLTTEELINIVSLDAIFFIELLLLEDNEIFIHRGVDQILKKDLLLLENQIPLFIHLYLCERCSITSTRFLRLLSNFFAIKESVVCGLDEDIVYTAKHVLDLIRLMYTKGVKEKKTTTEEVQVESATTLKKHGFKFHSIRGEGLCSYKLRKTFEDMQFLMSRRILLVRSPNKEEEYFKLKNLFRAKILACPAICEQLHEETNDCNMCKVTCKGDVQTILCESIKQLVPGIISQKRWILLDFGCPYTSQKPCQNFDFSLPDVVVSGSINLVAADNSTEHLLSKLGLVVGDI